MPDPSKRIGKGEDGKHLMAAAGIVIPFGELSPEALQGLLEEYVSREGTDYGHATFSLAQKVDTVRRQLEAGRAVIVYDPVSRSCNIVPRQDLSPNHGGAESR